MVAANPVPVMDRKAGEVMRGVFTGQCPKMVIYGWRLLDDVSCGKGPGTNGFVN